MTVLQEEHARHTVLVVDDDRQVLKMLRHILESDGFDVVTVESGEQALERLETLVPSLVLTDVHMPGISGFALCRRIKQDPRMKQVPVALATGAISSEDVEAGIAAGAVDYIKKPFDPAEIRMRVRTQISLHQAVDRLRRAENRLGAVTRATEDAVVLFDEEGHIAHWNRAAETMFGFSESEALGRHLDSFIGPSIFPEIRESATTDTDDDEVPMRTVELIAARRGGETFPVELSLSDARLDERWHAVAIVRDISARTALAQRLREEKLHREKMEVELRSSQKLEAVGQLAAGIAHEINTPAQYVGDNLRFLKDAFDDLVKVCGAFGALRQASKGGHVSPETVVFVENAVREADVDYLMEEIPKAIEQALEGIGRVSAIVRAMKEFAHPGSDEKVYADINKLLMTTITVSRNEWKYVSDIETDLDPTLPSIPCLPGELNQAFLNLIVNAAHAIGEVNGKKGDAKKGTIVVSTKKSGAFAEIRVRDTGPGIPESIRDRIMTPFFTTKPVGKGTGQGLAITRSVVVDKHHGALSFETEEGRGTTFIMRLPIEETGESRGTR